MRTGTLARTIITLGLLAVALTAGEASAGIFRAYLSLNGNDANPCTLPQPCRLLPAALAAINDGGEIWMLDSANFNTTTVTVAKSVTILAVPGALGSVVANGADAVNISAGGAKVTFRNVAIINLSGVANTGIRLLQGAELTVEGCELHGMNIGVSVLASGSSTTIKDTIIRDTTSTGVQADSQATGTSKVQLRNAGLLNNLTGLTVSGRSSVSIAGSAISGSTTGVFVNAGGGTTAQLAASNSTITGNTTGLQVSAATGSDTAQAMIDNVTFSQNSTGLIISGATATVFTRANNTFKFNTVDVAGGSLTALVGEANPCPTPTDPVNVTPFTDLSFQTVSGYGSPGQILVFSDSAQIHQIIALELPKSGGVRVASAVMQFVGWSNYPQYIEAGISRCRGDFSYSLSAAGAVNQFSQTFYPCHVYADGINGNQLYFGPVGDSQTCQIPNDNSTWYINFRYVNAPIAGAGYGCPTGTCRSVTSWGPH